MRIHPEYEKVRLNLISEAACTGRAVPQISIFELLAALQVEQWHALPCQALTLVLQRGFRLAGADPILTHALPKPIAVAYAFLRQPSIPDDACLYSNIRLPQMSCRQLHAFQIFHPQQMQQACERTTKANIKCQSRISMKPDADNADVLRCMHDLPSCHMFFPECLRRGLAIAKACTSLHLKA